jgi:hypothetical protein
MRCYCCESEMPTGRKVKLRGVQLDARFESPAPPAYQSYFKDTTFRWAFVCLPCYRALDNPSGVAEIGGRLCALAGLSRGDKAVLADEEEYQAFQREEAAKLGLEPE